MPVEACKHLPAKAAGRRLGPPKTRPGGPIADPRPAPRDPLPGTSAEDDPKIRIGMSPGPWQAPGDSELPHLVSPALSSLELVPSFDLPSCTLTKGSARSSLEAGNLGALLGSKLPLLSAYAGLGEGRHRHLRLRRCKRDVSGSGHVRQRLHAHAPAWQRPIGTLFMMSDSLSGDMAHSIIRAIVRLS
jgi:hypothetical protein